MATRTRKNKQTPTTVPVTVPAAPPEPFTFEQFQDRVRLYIESERGQHEAVLIKVREAVACGTDLTYVLDWQAEPVIEANYMLAQLKNLEYVCGLHGVSEEEARQGLEYVWHRLQEAQDTNVSDMMSYNVWDVRSTSQMSVFAGKARGRALGQYHRKLKQVERWIRRVEGFDALPADPTAGEGRSFW